MGPLGIDKPKLDIISKAGAGVNSMTLEFPASSIVLKIDPEFTIF